MKPFATSAQAPCCHGFTLLELMVSTALIGIIMSVLLMATSTSLSMWRSSEDKISVDREGRTAAALMSEDLRNMVAIPGINAEFRNPGGGGVFMEFFVLKPQDYQDAEAGNVGDVCFVQYRLQDNAIQRGLVESKASFDAIRGGGKPTVPGDQFEMLATNVRNVFFTTYKPDGTLDATAPEYGMVSLSVELLDAQDMENLRLNEQLIDTDKNPRGSKQFFQITSRIPRP